MSIRHLSTVLLAIGLLSTAAGARAASSVVLPAFDTAKVVAEQQQIRRDADARTGRYKTMTSEKRERLFNEQNRLLSVIDSHDYKDLNSEQRLQAFNSLEAISGLLNNEDDERMVCERVKTVGSNRVDRVCMTVAQRELSRERARENLDRNSTLGR